MTTATLKVSSQVQDFLNSSFDLFCDKFLNIREGHNFDIKQEIIGRTGLWVAKKRYATWIINDNGVPKDKIDYKGLDVVRSSFPDAFKGFLKELSTDILKGTPPIDVDNKVVDFKKKIRTLTFKEIAQPTSVQKLTKYGTKMTDKRKIFGNWIKGTPYHVKAALSYNEFLIYHHLEKKFAKISNGDKIRLVYLKTNPFGISAMAFRGYDDPPEVYDFINKYINKTKMFEHILESKIKDFYGAMAWDIPSEEQEIINKFFDF